MSTSTTDPIAPPPPLPPAGAPPAETAPSQIYDEGQGFGRMVGFAGLFGLVLGAVVVITNQALDRQNLTQFGRQVHSSMCRAIQPFHGLYDGDVLYAVTTAAVPAADLSTEDLGLLAGELAWDAVLQAVTAGR